MNLNNPHYKHGVRRALAGDDWCATVAFAQAARDHREDPLVRALKAVSVCSAQSPVATSDVADIPAKPGQQDYRRVVLSCLKAWAASDLAGSQMFVRRYGVAGVPNWVSVLLVLDVRAPCRLADFYLTKLRTAFSRTNGENPLAGSLDRQQLIRLQK